MLNTSCASQLHSDSRRCRLGFHRWAEARNDMNEKVFMCLRCGHLDTDDGVSSFPMAAFAYFAGGVRGPMG